MVYFTSSENHRCKKGFFTFLTFFIFHTFGKIKKSENLRPAQAMVSFHFFHAERF